MKDRKKLQDILDAIVAIETYAVSSYADFLADAKTQDAMIGTRNIIVHGYDQVKLPIVWEILERDLASLKAEILKALST